MAVRGRFDRRLDIQDRLRLILVQRGTAFSAKIVGGPELDEMTMVATYHFPGINRRQCCSHDDFGVPEQAVSPKTTAWGLEPLRGAANDCELERLRKAP